MIAYYLQKYNNCNASSVPQNNVNELNPRLFNLLINSCLNKTSNFKCSCQRTGLKWKREVPKRDEKLARSFDFKADEAEKQAASLRRKTNLANSYEHNGEESNLDEMKVSPERHAAAWITATPPGERTRSSFGRHMASVGLTHFDTRPFKKGRDIGYNQAKANQDSLLKNLGEAMVPSMPAIFSALSRSSRTARNPSARRPAPKDNGYWRGTLELGGPEAPQDPEQKAAMARHPLNGKIDRMARDRRYKTEAYDDTNEFGETHLETRNFEHNYLHSHISDHIEAIHKTIQAHVQLMDSMNDHQHEGNFRQLLKTHDALEDLSHKIQKMHTNAKTRMGMHPKAEPVRDMSDRPMVGAAFPHAEGYEHIAALTESDQALLVDTYNSLSEENQDRFLELAETEEGVDELIDFAIKQRAE
jgi:hypothetical protein